MAVVCFSPSQCRLGLEVIVVCFYAQLLTEMIVLKNIRQIDDTLDYNSSIRLQCFDEINRRTYLIVFRIYPNRYQQK